MTFDAIKLKKGLFDLITWTMIKVKSVFHTYAKNSLKMFLAKIAEDVEFRTSSVDVSIF